MSDRNFVYGVFRQIDKAIPVVDKLHQAGFCTEQIGILGTKSKKFQYVSARLEDPAARNFLLWGAFGCIGGLCAGIAGSPHIPNLPFQILSPLMAAISAGVVMAYFGSFMGVFLNSSKPQHWANVFQGTIEVGSVLVLAQCDSREQMRTAMEIIETEEPVELVVREKQFYGLVPELDVRGVEQIESPATLSAVA